MRDVVNMIERMKQMIGNEIPEELDLSIKEFSALNELAEASGEAKLFNLISNSFLFGMACTYDYLSGEKNHIALTKGFLDHVWDKYTESGKERVEYEADDYDFSKELDKSDELLKEYTDLIADIYFAAGIDAANRISSGELKVNKFMALR